MIRNYNRRIFHSRNNPKSTGVIRYSFVVLSALIISSLFMTVGQAAVYGASCPEAIEQQNNPFYEIINMNRLPVPQSAESSGMHATGVQQASEVNITLEGNFGGVTCACAVSGDYAYIGQGQYFVVLDVSNPAVPVELGRLRTGDIIRDIAVSGSYAYVADNYNGLVIVDITNPAAPALAGSYTTVGYAWDVVVSGSYAYVRVCKN